MSRFSPPIESLSRTSIHLLLLLLVVASVAVRWRFFFVPLERDEGEYAYFGQLILAGGVPYRDAYNMKPPGIYYAHAAIVWLFGSTIPGIRAGVTLVTIAAAYCFYRWTRRWLPHAPALAATATFVVASASSASLGFASKAEHYVVACALAALWLGSSARAARSPWRLGTCGALLACATAMKPSGLVFAAYQTWYTLAWQPRFRAAAVGVCALWLGFALVWVGIGLYLWWVGALANAWFWTVTYALHYAAGLPFSEGAVAAATTLAHLCVGAPMLWLAAGLGYALPLAAPPPHRVRRERYVFLLLSAVGVALGWRFSEHYFLLLTPALARGVGWLAASPALVPRWRALVVTVAIATAAAQEQLAFWGRSPADVARAIYGRNPFPEAVAIGQFLRTHSDPADLVAVIGSEPEIYVYARRRAATGFLYTYPLMELHPFAIPMQHQMIREIESARPRYLVLVHVPTSWSLRSQSATAILDWSATYANTYYTPVGLVDIPPQGPSRFHWGEAARVRQPESDFFLAIFERSRR